MTRITLIITIIILFASCKGPEARRPVTVKTGSFMRESIDRNKALLAQEEAAIADLIKKDTVNTYYNSSNGYWYFYNVKDSLADYTPQKGDELLITYDIRTLDDKTIYSKEEIGDISFVVDKEDYFPGLRTGIKLMKEGETVTFFFPSALGYGYHGDKNKIGTNEPLISTVSLLDIIRKEKDSVDTDLQ